MLLDDLKTVTQDMQVYSSSTAKRIPGKVRPLQEAHLKSVDDIPVRAPLHKQRHPRCRFDVRDDTDSCVVQLAPRGAPALKDPGLLAMLDAAPSHGGWRNVLRVHASLDIVFREALHVTRGVHRARRDADRLYRACHGHSADLCAHGFPTTLVCRKTIVKAG